MKKKLTLETRLEIRSVLSLSSIFALRMLAVFMLIPVFTLYASSLKGASSFLIGIAIGIYGLVQAICQLPLGALSDKYNRKLIITLGLALFALGSLLAAWTDNIYLMIAARMLQGMGAVGSTLMALLADLTSEKNRTKAMAVLGISMGLSSALAMIVGPAIAAHYGLSGVFLASAFLAVGSIVILWGVTPRPMHMVALSIKSISMVTLFRQILKEPLLLQWDMGIFLLHAIFTALFYACPLILKPLLPDTAYFYLIIIGITFVLLFPSISLAEKKRKTSQAFVISIILLLIAQCILLVSCYFQPTLWNIGAALVLFFLGFNFLEAALPSMITKAAPPAMRGTAMSVYSCAQFLGIFVGGTLAGIAFSFGGVIAIFMLTTLFAIIWLSIALKYRTML